ncbi:hypothetical protein GNI_035520 [Gregarina niphandrodes]|uniref:Uncharacterized protein n=1 Tax=Gregarina niphandrodes TaxID=110365 RepID=A0A023BAZ4_GRENI|nr:hypothetical protein GNI_035520 [Gregarina niphandrodes]EZG78496.1 hypothetical protein GNI_035520 [Gregarina niphandrodes]|eukprot:XP_011129280.1 hypothetical protein GNI_035520 [Gregarina niphandrodes]
MNQLRAVVELCKLSRLLCDLVGSKVWGVGEALDVEVKTLSYPQLCVVGRLFVGVLLTLVAHASASLPSEAEVDQLVVRSAIPLLKQRLVGLERLHQTDLHHAELFRTVRDALLTDDGLEELRSATFKFAKIYNLFLTSYKQKMQELITFATIDPDATTPKSKPLLERAIDLKRNLERIGDIDNAPDAVTLPACPS